MNVSLFLQSALHIGVLSGAVLAVFVLLLAVSPLLAQRWSAAPPIPAYLWGLGILALLAHAFWNYYQAGGALGSLYLPVFSALLLAALCVLAWRFARGDAGVPVSAQPYVLIWLFWTAYYALRSVDPHLPYVTMGNNDVWSYLKFADIALFGRGADNIVDVSLSENTANFQTPLAVILLGSIAAVFKTAPSSVLTACSVILVSAQGMISYRLCRRYVVRSPVIAFLSVVVCGLGGLMLMMAGNTFLAQMMGVTLSLAIVWVVLDERAGPWRTPSLVLLFYLLLMSYLTAFAVFMPLYGLLCVLIGFRAVGDYSRIRDVLVANRPTIAMLCAPVIAGVLYALLEITLFQHKYAEILAITSGLPGWPYKLLNPIGLIWPLAAPDAGPAVVKWVGWLALAVLTAFLAWRATRPSVAAPAAPAERRASFALLATAAASILFYLAFYIWRGESYPQWKMGLSVILPFGAVLIAAPFALAQGHRVPSLRHGVVAGGGLLLAVFGLLAVRHQVEMMGPMRSTFVAYPPLLTVAAQAEATPDGAVLIDVGEDFGATMVLAQAITKKPVRLYSPNYYFRHDARAPLGIPHGVAVLSGCTVLDASFAPIPSGGLCLTSQMRENGYAFTFGYSASGALLGGGWYNPEPWGRWNDGVAADMTLPVNPSWPSANVAMDLLVFLDCTPSQHVTISTNGEVVAELELTSSGVTQFTIPQRLFADDGTVPLRLDMPQAVAPASCTASTDVRLLSVGLVGLQVTRGQ